MSRLGSNEKLILSTRINWIWYCKQRCFNWRFRFFCPFENYVDVYSGHNAFFAVPPSILNSHCGWFYIVIAIAHALVSSRTTVHGQGHGDNKRVVMNDVLPSKKRARRIALAHVGSLYEPLTRFNGTENYDPADNPIAQVKCTYCVTITCRFYTRNCSLKKCYQSTYSNGHQINSTRSSEELLSVSFINVSGHQSGRCYSYINLLCYYNYFSLTNGLL